MSNATRTPRIDLRLSRESLADLQKFRKEMEATQNKTNELAQDLKNLGQLTKALQMREIAISRGGAGGYLEGKRVRGAIDAERTNFLGSDLGKTMAFQREITQNLKAAEQHIRNSARYQAAINLDLAKELQSVRGIKSIKDAELLVDRSSQRILVETLQGNRQMISQAQQLNTLANERLAKLRQEAVEQKKVADAQARRQNELSRLRTRDPELERARAEASRRSALERISGDGGAFLFQIQTRLLANYAAMNLAVGSITDGLRFAVDFDNSLRNLQAIVVVTDENMLSLRENILEVANATKFGANEVANAAVTLGQAGFSVKEIEQSLGAVALLATATGTDFARATDIATSVIGVFEMEASQMAGVASTLTAAINQSKLSMDKVALGIQYAGNTAAQSGVSFEEMVASLGAMANAGIRSGSTLGTGLRQILISLQEPSGDFLATMDRLGLTMADVDLRTKGLTGVMETLKGAGFTASDAIKSFEVRAAAAFNAMSGNLNDVLALERAMLNNAAAQKANETQMRSLANQAERFQGNLAAVVTIGMEPLIYAARDVLSALSEWLDVLQEMPALLQTVTTGLVGLAGGFIAVKSAALITGLAKAVGSLKNLFTTVAGGVASLRTLGGAAAVAGRGVSLLLGPVGVLATAMSFGISAWMSYSKEMENAASAVQRAQTAFDDANGALDAVASQIEMVDERIKSLTDRSERLSTNQNEMQLEIDKARQQFQDMGIQIDDNVDTVGELIGALVALRGQLAQDYVLNLQVSSEKLGTVIQSMKDQLNSLGAEYSARGLQDAMALNPAAGQAARRAQNGGAVDVQQTIDDMAILNAEIARLESKPNIGGRDSALETLREAVKVLQQRLDLTQRITSAERQQLDQNRKLLDEQNKLENAPLVNKVDLFGKGAYADVQAAAAGIEDPIEAYRAASQRNAELEAAAAELRREIESSTTLSATNQASMLQDLENQMSQVDVLTSGLKEKAIAAAENMTEIEEIVAQNRDTTFNRDLAKAKTAAEAGALGAQAIADNDAQYEARLNELALQFGDDTTSEAYIARAEALALEQQADNERIQQAVNDRLVKINQLNVGQTSNLIESIERQLENETDTETRAQLTETLKAAIEARAEKQKENAYLTAESLADYGVEMARIDAETAAAFAELDKANIENEIQLQEQAVEQAKETWDALISLAETAQTIAEEKALLQAAAEQQAKFAEEQAKLTAMRANAGLIGPTQVNLAQLNLEKTLRDMKSRVSGVAGGPPGKNPTGGGGKKETDPVDEMIARLDSQLQAAEIMVKAGKAQNVTFENALDTAGEELEKITSQIGALQARMVNGQLTADEQERLNKLVDQHKKLTDMIISNEEKIIELKYRQGDIQGGINAQVGRWANENLDMTTTFMGGITNSLSAAKSGLTDFFNSWSDGTKKGKDAFRQLAVGVIRSIQNIFAEMLAVYILQKTLGWLFPGANFGGMGGFSMDFSSLFSGVRAMGGEIPRDGGMYKLRPGEMVMQKSAVDFLGLDEVKKMNAMGNNVANRSAPKEMPRPEQKEPGKVNVYVMAPDQKPNVGPNDIIAVISDDIMRGGATKKLIKQVQMGH